MLTLKVFTFSPIRENTYVLFNEQRQAIIIDPGCYFSAEEEMLNNYIQTEGLQPTLLLNTHCHLDHVFGNRWVHQTYGLELHIHAGEKIVLEKALEKNGFKIKVNIEDDLTKRKMNDLNIVARKII